MTYNRSHVLFSTVLDVEVTNSTSAIIRWTLPQHRSLIGYQLVVSRAEGLNSHSDGAVFVSNITLNSTTGVNVINGLSEFES